jgi:hypothetical protein
VDNSRTLQLPTDFLTQLQNRGINLADRGFDLSNPNLNITDLRVTRDMGTSVEWEKRFSSRIGANISAGESRFQDLRERSSALPHNANTATRSLDYFQGGSYASLSASSHSRRHPALAHR